MSNNSVYPPALKTTSADSEARREGLRHWVVACIGGALLVTLFFGLGHSSTGTAAPREAHQVLEHFEQAPLLLLAVINVVTVLVQAGGVFIFRKHFNKWLITGSVWLLETLAHTVSTGFGGLAMIEVLPYLMRQGTVTDIDLKLPGVSLAIGIWVAMGITGLSANMTLVLAKRAAFAQSPRELALAWVAGLVAAAVFVELVRH